MSAEPVARTVLWPQPLRKLGLQDPGLTVSREGPDGEQLRVRVSRPAKGLLFFADKPVDFSDNSLDLLPGDERIITAKGLLGQVLYCRSLQGAHACL